MTQPFDYHAETVACDLCNSSQYATYLIGRDMLYEFPGEWTVVQCKHCGLIFTNPRPASDSIGFFYPDGYGPHQAKSSRHTPSNHRQQWALHKYWNYPPPEKATFIDQLLSKPTMWGIRLKSRNFDLFPWQGEGKLLDYGCGGGGYLVRMQNRGWQVMGMDMSPTAVDHTRSQGVDACMGVDPTQFFEKESFDVITSWHVIEHVPSPTQTLGQFRAILKPQGRLVMTIPNVNSQTAKWFGYCWFPYELPRHFTHFTPETITKLLEKAGYVVENIKSQRHSQITKKCMAYLYREKKTLLYKLLSNSRLSCSLIETYCNLIGKPARMVVYARKV